MYIFLLEKYFQLIIRKQICYYNNNNEYVDIFYFLGIFFLGVYFAILIRTLHNVSCKVARSTFS